MFYWFISLERMDGWVVVTQSNYACVSSTGKIFRLPNEMETYAKDEPDVAVV